MDTKEYIASGILESYVLGGTSPDETAEVEQMIIKHPEIAAEVEALRMAVEDFAWQNAVEPPASLRARVLQALEALNETQANPQPAAPTPGVFGQNRWMIAASWALLVLSALANVVLFNRWQSTETQLADLQSESQIIAQQLNVSKASYLAANQEIELLRNPAVKTIPLKGTPDAPEASAVVYWNTAKSEVYLSALNLPATTSQQQYQLWAIIDGKPVDAGVFDLSTNVLKLKDIKGAVAFAISLEAKGGSSTEAGPKGKVYVMGAVS